MTEIKTKPAIQKAWWYLWRLARFRVGLYLLSGLTASTTFYLVPLLPGLIVRRVFDLLSANAQVGLPDASVWALIALLAGIAVGRVSAIFGAVAAENSTQLIAAALLRQNVLERILHRPGANALPPGSSPGEAISRFRNDVQAVVHFLT